MQNPLIKQSEHQEDLRLAQCCVKDRASRAKVYKRHAAAVYRLVHRILGNPSDAEDVMQEVFMAVFASIHNYRGEAPLASWIRRITVRTTFHLLKKRPPRASLESVERLPEQHADPFGALSNRALCRRIYQLLNRLNPKLRMVFVLHEVEGYSLPEAAALLNISVTAAKKRVWRARQELEGFCRKDGLLSKAFTDVF